ncbi:MAG: ABC transporter permease [Bacteroidota bacterium]
MISSNSPTVIQHSALRFVLPVWTLLARELTRFYRQRSRVIGVIGSPLVFWLLIGFGLGDSFRPSAGTPGENYLEYFYPGTIVLIVLFTAIFSTISIIEDRREGFLQSVLVAPIPRSSLVLGKVLGGAVLAFLQGLIMLLLAPLVGFTISIASAVLIALILFMIAFALTGLGFLIAWHMDSTQGFHAIMNLVLIPLWMLSGALFPSSGAPKWLYWTMELNPLTYAVSGLRSALYFEEINMYGLTSELITGLLVTLGFGIVTFAAAVIAARQPIAGERT